MVENTEKEEGKQIVLPPTACDIVVDHLKSNKTDRENFLSAYGAGRYARDTAVFVATQKGFSRFGKGEGDVPIRANKKGKIISYIDQNGAEIPTNSCVTKGHYNVTQSRKPEFISGIAETLPYGEVQKRLVIEARDIPELLKDFITANHTPASQKLPSAYKREYMNFTLSIKDLQARTKRTHEILPMGELAQMNCKACASVILRTAVREEENGKKTVIKQSELKEEIIAGAENYLYALVLEEMKTDTKKEDQEPETDDIAVKE